MSDNNAIFSVMEGRCDGYPIVAMIRSRLKDCREESGTPWFFGLSTKLLYSTLEGLPTAEEADDLNRWEDTIERKISMHCKYVFAGRVTWKGNRELLYYVDAAELVAKEIQELINARAIRTFAFRYEHDPDWTNVSIYSQ